MSIGLSCFIEVKNKETGKWEEHKFKWREPLAYDYAVFSYDAISFLTGFKNDANMPTIGEDKFYRGYPKDSDWLNAKASDNPNDIGGMYWSFGNETVLDTIKNDNDYAISFVTLQELLDFDYDQEFENLCNPLFGWHTDKRRTLPVGEGFIDTVRNCLCPSFFNALDYLKELGNPKDVRVIYNLD